MLDNFKPLSIWVKTCWLLLRAGRFVFATLIGGSLFAYLAGNAGFLLSFFHTKSTTENLQHIGWIVGVVVTVAGIAMGRIKANFFIKWDPTRTNDSKPSQAESKPAKEANGICGNAGFFALLGVIVGVLVSTVLLMSWFSISVSPLAPASWGSSVDAVSASGLDSDIHEGASGEFSTNNPMVLRLFWMPTAMLSAIGLIVGALVGIVDKFRKKDSA